MCELPGEPALNNVSNNEFEMGMNNWRVQRLAGLARRDPMNDPIVRDDALNLFRYCEVVGRLMCASAATIDPEIFNIALNLPDAFYEYLSDNANEVAECVRYVQVGLRHCRNLRLVIQSEPESAQRGMPLVEEPVECYVEGDRIVPGPPLFTAPIAPEIVNQAPATAAEIAVEDDAVSVYGGNHIYFCNYHNYEQNLILDIVDEIDGFIAHIYTFVNYALCIVGQYHLVCHPVYLRPVVEWLDTRLFATSILGHGTMVEYESTGDDVPCAGVDVDMRPDIIKAEDLSHKDYLMCVRRVISPFMRTAVGNTFYVSRTAYLQLAHISVTNPFLPDDVLETRLTRAVGQLSTVNVDRQLYNDTYDHTAYHHTNLVLMLQAVVYNQRQELGILNSLTPSGDHYTSMVTDTVMLSSRSLIRSNRARRYLFGAAFVTTIVVCRRECLWVAMWLGRRTLLLIFRTLVQPWLEPLRGVLDGLRRRMTASWPSWSNTHSIG